MMELNRKTRAKLPLLVGLLASSLGLLSGCGAAGESDQVVEAEATGTVNQALVPPGSYNYAEIGPFQGGGSPKDLTFDASGNWNRPGTCFLSAVGGKFEGGGEWVSVDQLSNGVWRLSSGTGQGRSPFAAASCLLDPVSTKGSWRKGMRGVNLQVGGTCFLTRIEGKFVGGGEWVGVWQNSDRQWVLGGGSQTAETIAANAVCIRAEQTSFAQQGGQNWAVSLGKKARRACFLQKVIGGLQGDGEKIDIEGVGNYFHLNGQTQSPSSNFYIEAAAGCVSAPGSILDL